MKFDKKPLAIEQQLEMLSRRGMEVPDKERALHALQHINYYRLRAYWRNFEVVGAPAHTFKPGTNLDDVITLYVFDRELRLYLMDLIERFEVSVRSQWAHVLAMHHGAHSYLDESLFYSQQLHQESLEKLRSAIDESQEEFVQHYLATYTDPQFPPIWAMCELLSLGQLSKWYGNLATRWDRVAIAKPYGVDEAILKSFLMHLSHVRNFCAHHCRVWNRKFTVTMTPPKAPLATAPRFVAGAPARRLHNTIAFLGNFISVISPASEWRRHFLELINRYPRVEMGEMGFPDGWRELSPWKEPAPAI